MNRSTLSICLLILVLLLAIQFDSPLIQYLDPAGDTRISLTPNRDFTTLENKECANVTDAIWTYLRGDPMNLWFLDKDNKLIKNLISDSNNSYK